jgi:hypothetical protein
MSNEDNRWPTYYALSDKRIALSAYIQELLSRTSEDPDTVSIEVGRADIELRLVNATMTELGNNIPIQFPSLETVQSMQRDVANLQSSIARGAVLNELVAAGDQLLAAWPN